MNILKGDKLARLIAALSQGESYRAAARAAGGGPHTVMRYAHLVPGQRWCPCGQAAGHRGWCAYRFQQSAARQAWMRAWRAVRAAERQLMQEMNQGDL